MTRLLRHWVRIILKILEILFRIDFYSSINHDASDVTAIILRYAKWTDKDQRTTMQAHEAVAGDDNTCWWGWWHKAGVEKLPRGLFDQLKNRDIPVYLFDSSAKTFHKARLKDIDFATADPPKPMYLKNNDERQKIPEHYRETPLLAYFKLDLGNSRQFEKIEHKNIVAELKNYSYLESDELFTNGTPEYEKQFYNTQVDPRRLEYLDWQDRTIWFLRNKNSNELPREAEKPFIPEPKPLRDDEPSEKDFLDFEKHVKLIAKELVENRLSSIVFGLYGKWGSGKSSFLKQLKAEIEKISKKPNFEPIVLEFNAWKHGDRLEVALSKELQKEINKHRKFIQNFVLDLNYPSIFQRFIEDVREPFIENLKTISDKRFKIYWPILIALLILSTIFYFINLLLKSLGISLFIIFGLTSELKVIALTLLLICLPLLLYTFVFSLLKLLIDAIALSVCELLGDYIDTFRVGNDYMSMDISIKRLERTKRHLSKNQKIYLFIDELDRCPPNQIVHMLETVKLFLVNEKIITFISIDYDVVINAIEENLKFDGKKAVDYLEKIVQVPLSVPLAPEFKEGANGDWKKGLETIEKILNLYYDRVLLFRLLLFLAHMDINQKLLFLLLYLLLPSIKEDEKAFYIEFLKIFNQSLRNNPRQFKKILNTYHWCLKLLIANHDETKVLKKSLVRNFLFWLAYTCIWPEFFTKLVNASTKTGTFDQIYWYRTILAYSDRDMVDASAQSFFDADFLKKNEIGLEKGCRKPSPEQLRFFCENVDYYFVKPYFLEYARNFIPSVKLFGSEIQEKTNETCYRRKPF